MRGPGGMSASLFCGYDRGEVKARNPGARRTGLAVLAAVCGLLWAAPGARAGGVAVLTYQAAEAPATTAAVGREIEGVIQGKGGTPVMEPFRAAAEQLELGAVPRARLADFRRVRQLVRQGWLAYVTVEPAYAASRLSEARRVAERVLALDGGPEAYADVSLRLAVVLLDLGRKQEASALFRIAATLQPDREVTLAEFSPDVVAAHQAAAAGGGSPVAVRIEVDLGRASANAQAEVEVNGKGVGRAPVSIELLPGQHVVVARAAGYVSQARAFAVLGAGSAPGGEHKERLTLQFDAAASAVGEGRPALAVGRAEAKARVAVEGLVLYGDFDAVLLVAAVWRRGAPALLGQWCRSVPASCGAVVEVGYDAPEKLPAAARRLWQSVRQKGRFPPTLLVDARLVSGESAPGTGPGNGKGGGSNWWKWALAGVGASAAIIVTGLALSRDTEVRPVFVGDPCDFGGC